MSAWIVSRDLIDALVCGAFEYGVPFHGKDVTQENATAIGQVLWEENVRSVEARYGRPRPDLPGPNDYTPPGQYRFIGETRLKPSWLHQQASCYAYQTCEHDAWPESAAYQFIADLKAAIETRMEKDNDAMYALAKAENAPWGI